MDKPTQTHVLFEFSPLDYWDDIDERTQKAYQYVKQLINGKSPKECQELYLKHIASNQQQNTEELTIGLLIAILIGDGQQSKYYRDIVTFSKDGLTFFSAYLNIIITDKLSRLRDQSIKQIFWIAHQLMKAGANTAESVCSNLIRQTAGGDLSAKNLWLVENLLGLLSENRSWLINQTSFMVPTSIYTFMRLIGDHMGPAQNALRHKEVEFVIGLIREKFLDCLQIGRDFLRLLHNVIKVPEFEKLWNDIFNNPKSLHLTFQSPLQFLSSRTPRRLFQSRLTFEMERKINFLATQVKFGNQKRYQDWFYKQYLTTSESLSLRCDLIRYICAIIHPSNEVLCSDIIPRWAIIGWLLNNWTSGNATNSVKLALFFDWLVYDPKMDNIMNIEPAILLMHYSMRSHPIMTSSLIDYLCRMPSTFSPKLHDHIKAGIKNSIQQILEKRVIPTITHLFENPKFDPALRALIRENFAEFCTAPVIDNGISHTTNNTSNTTANNNTNASNNAVTNSNSKQPEVIILDHDNISTNKDGNNSIQRDNNHPIAKNNPPNLSLNEDKPDQQGSSSGSFLRDDAKSFTWNPTENASYSHKQNHDNKNRKLVTGSNAIDHKDDWATTGLSCKTPSLTPQNTRDIWNVTPSTPEELLDDYNMPRLEEEDFVNNDDSNMRVIYPFMVVPQLPLKKTISTFDEPIRKILEEFTNASGNESRCSMMDKLISAFVDNSEQTTDANMLRNLGHCLAHLVVDDFSKRIFPASSSQSNESLEKSVSSPLFVLCRCAFTVKRPEVNKPMTLLVAIAEFLKATGFLVLYFLRVNVVVANYGIYWNYLRFCKLANRKISRCLYDDLFMAFTYDSEMFCFLLPSVFGELAVNGTFTVTNNIDLIRLVASGIDPVHLQELICLCVTSTTKIIDKEAPLSLIESSLSWESWEQYCLWKLISAQNVPIENYIAILPKLNPQTNAEALSSILLNLQKVIEPTYKMVEQVMDCDAKANESFVTSILRYWSIKTDMNNLVQQIIAVNDLQPSSPNVKRKGQGKASKNSSTLTPRNERILNHLASIRSRAPKNKLLTHADIIEMLVHAETICNETQRKKFAELFTNIPSANKKVKKEKETP